MTLSVGDITKIIQNLCNQNAENPRDPIKLEILASNIDDDDLYNLLDTIAKVPALLINLAVMDLRHNFITLSKIEVFDILKLFKNLRIINLHNNKVENLSARINELQSLIEIDLSCNKLKTLPDLKLPELTKLSLQYNQLQINPNIGGCTKLSTLILIHNNMRYFKMQGLYPSILKLEIRDGNVIDPKIIQALEKARFAGSAFKVWKSDKKVEWAAMLADKEDEGYEADLDLPTASKVASPKVAASKP